LGDLRHVIRDRKIESIAIPPLGCGNGGLHWRDVRPLILEALSDLPEVQVVIYPPKGAPPAESMAIGTERPKITSARAALLSLLARYVRLRQAEQSEVTDGASLLEMQKLMYFLQAAGQPLRLNYVKARYGPYAENLNHALQPLEGHYLRGYGDRSQLVMKLSPIVLLPGAEEEASRLLDEDTDATSTRIDAVLDLVTGFASAYGLELLATVHWVMTHAGGDRPLDPASLTQHVASWNERKGRLFTEVHVSRAMDRVRDLGWVPGPPGSR
jgi:O-acetyl-ADP-ribose deacetylase (regulator of RNase III)